MRAQSFTNTRASLYVLCCRFPAICTRQSKCRSWTLIAKLLPCNLHAYGLTGERTSKVRQQRQRLAPQSVFRAFCRHQLIINLSDADQLCSGFLVLLGGHADRVQAWLPTAVTSAISKDLLQSVILWRMKMSRFECISIS